MPEELFIPSLGVLTKVDRIDAGTHASWLKILKNEEEPLVNNWFCVKQPSASELKLGITYEEARERENSFFATTAPWKDLDPMYQKYLKTSNLIGRLSNLLSDLIAKRYVSSLI
jgi:hypothetical protein